MLWVDLSSVRDQASPYCYLNDEWSVYRISNADKIDPEIRRTLPALLCFEYDYPDFSSLSALRQARCSFPSIPIIMLTEQHFEELAIWALRTRVWDYFVKPIQAKELVTSVATLLAEKAPSKNKTIQQDKLSNPIPVEVRCRPWQKKKTDPAQFFVESHYHERVCEEEVAHLCGVSVSTFSRHFKKEHEMTFRDYLINYRINKASELLQTPNASVTDIAYTVGFHDPSYFTRTFRRIVGMSPSHYREVNTAH